MRSFLKSIDTYSLSSSYLSLPTHYQRFSLIGGGPVTLHLLLYVGCRRADGLTVHRCADVLETRDRAALDSSPSFYDRADRSGRRLRRRALAGRHQPMLYIARWRVGLRLRSQLRRTIDE